MLGDSAIYNVSLEHLHLVIFCHDITLKPFQEREMEGNLKQSPLRKNLGVTMDTRIRELEKPQQTRTGFQCLLFQLIGKWQALQFVLHLSLFCAFRYVLYCLFTGKN